MSVQFLTATTAKATSMSDAQIHTILTNGAWINALLLIVMIFLLFRIAQLKKKDGRAVETTVRQRRTKLNEQSVGRALEKQILNLAAVRGGILGVVETAYHTKLSMDISERALESFVRRGYAEIQDRNGAPLYHFQGILTEYEKEAAKSLNDLLEEKA